MLYEIGYTHKKNDAGELISGSIYVHEDKRYSLTCAKLTIEQGKAGTLTLGIPYSNPAREEIVCLTDEIYVREKDTGTEIFRGRCITRQKDFYLTETLTVEGVLAYLHDTYYEPFTFAGSPKQLLENVIRNHNRCVGEDENKQFEIGTVTVEDPSDYIARSSENYNRSIEILNDKLAGSSLGGVFRASCNSGRKKLDYLSSYNRGLNDQRIEFGSNLLDIATEVEWGNLITAVLPLGERRTVKDPGGGTVTAYVGVAGANNGDKYIRDESLIEKYGFICECVQWEDVTEPSNLKKKAQMYLAQNCVAIKSMTIAAVDLAKLGFLDSVNSFQLGDSVIIKSKPHDINQIIELTGKEMDLLNPINDSFTFGNTGSVSMTQSSASSSRNVSERISSLGVSVGKITADYITSENLSAEVAVLGYVTADQIEAEYTKTKDLEAEYIKAESADLKYATLESLKAAEASIRKLDTEKISATDADIKYATIENLKAAEASIRKLDTEKLGAADADIKYATIENLKAAEASIRKLDTEKISATDADIKYATIENLKAAEASIRKLDTEKLSAADADIKYANIDFSNIGKAAIEQFYATSGIIKNLVIGDQTITGELVGVTIKGDLIEGNTIVADKLVLRGSDGLYYKLNTNGVTVEKEQTDYNSLKGSILQAKSVTAEKIDVHDLVAFDATIAGFKITDSALYSGAKDSAINGTRGIYLGKDGQAGFGDGHNYLRYFKDTDGTWKLEISAASVEFSSGSSIEDTINDMQNRIDQIAEEVTTSIYISSSKGSVFKNTNVSTILSVTIVRGTQRITDSATMKSVFGEGAYLQWKYQGKDDDEFWEIPKEDFRISENGFKFKVNPSDIYTKGVYTCDLIN